MRVRSRRLSRDSLWSQIFNIRALMPETRFYARPVGNKSVQEAAAARAHEQADYGIVVSNNRYTQDAEQLASTNHILLLHYTDLRKLDDIIRLKSSPASDIWYYVDGDGQVGPLTLQELSGQGARRSIVACEISSNGSAKKTRSGARPGSMASS